RERPGGATHRDGGRPLRAARLLPVLLPALRLRAAADRAARAPRLRGTLPDRRDPPVAPRLPAAPLRESVQARLRARLTEDRLRRVALAARRLADARGRLSGDVARRRGVHSGDDSRPRAARSHAYPASGSRRLMPPGEAG